MSYHCHILQHRSSKLSLCLSLSLSLSLSPYFIYAFKVLALNWTSILICFHFFSSLGYLKCQLESKRSIRKTIMNVNDENHELDLDLQTKSSISNLWRWVTIYVFYFFIRKRSQSQLSQFVWESCNKGNAILGLCLLYRISCDTQNTTLHWNRHFSLSYCSGCFKTLVVIVVVRVFLVYQQQSMTNGCCCFML